MSESLLAIDGAAGEGGGQVLRSALTLSLLTQRAFHIRNIRGSRTKPGLMAQHLASVQAAADVGKARVAGDVLGSRELVFSPDTAEAGHYRFDIGTAGSTSLLLQTLALPLSYCRGDSEVTASGGTHVPWSPPFHYLSEVWEPILSGMGFKCGLALERPGYFPAGGGRVRMSVKQHGTLSPLTQGEPGELSKIEGISAVSNLPLDIAERQMRRLRTRLRKLGLQAEIEVIEIPAPSPGTFVFLRAEFSGALAGFSALGARGKPAERVADEAADQLEEFLASGAAVDKHLADQILLPLALVEDRSWFTVSEVSRHLITNAELIRLFLPAQIRIEGAEGMPGKVEILGSGRQINDPTRAELS